MNGEQPPPKKRRWPWIVLGVVLFFFVVTVGGCAVVITLIRNSVSVTDASATTADAEFEQLRAKFAGQQALIQMVDGRPEFVREGGRQSSSTASLKTMHIVAWDDDEGKLMKVAVPFWLLRLQTGAVRLNNYADGWDDSRLSFRVADLERAGPGLVADFTQRNEGRVLIWTE